MNKPRSLRTLVNAPILFSALLMVFDVVTRVFAPGYTGVSAMWFLPMCFVFVANAPLALVARIVALEAKSKQGARAAPAAALRTLPSPPAVHLCWSRQ